MPVSIIKGYDKLKKSIVIIYLFSLIELTSCTNSEMLRSWHSPYVETVPFKSILIISMKQKSRYRKIWEDAFCRDLRAHRVQGIASYLIFPDSVPDVYAVMHQVKSEQYDGVLLIDNGKKIRQYPPEPNLELQEQYTVPGDGGLMPVLYQDVLYPNEVTKDQNQLPIPSELPVVVEYEVQLYTTAGIGQLLWCGTGSVNDPGSRKEVRQSISQLVLKELETQGIISPVMSEDETNTKK